MRLPPEFRIRCVACDRAGMRMTKEHFWPQWLIERTKTRQTAVRLDASRKVNPNTLTVPLCASCNHDLGSRLEGPVSTIFDDAEAGRGLSDMDLELLVRWLWKFEGIAWRFAHPRDIYTDRYTIRERVLNPIDEIRSELAVAVSLVDEIHPDFKDAQMGVDSRTTHSAVFVSGVFSKLALMVLLRKFEGMVPNAFAVYHFSDRHAPNRTAKLFFPKAGFPTCVDAVGTTYAVSLELSYAHDLDSRNQVGGDVAA